MCSSDLRKETGRLPKDGALVTTIVSSNMAEAIGKEYGIDVIEVLTLSLIHI